MKSGSVAIVTGASGGIGLATARLLTKQGFRVGLVARSSEKLRHIASELNNSYAVTADLSDPDQIKAMVKTIFDHYGRIDVLINNAGQGYDAAAEDVDIKTLKSIFDLDFVGPLIAMQQVIPIMKAAGGGQIVNISSGTALMHLPNMGAYAAIKEALAHFSLTAREELKSDHISVSVVYPYITKTDFEVNTLKEGHLESLNGDSSYQPPQADSAEYVATLIVDCLENNPAEVFAHPFMKEVRQARASH